MSGLAELLFHLLHCGRAQSFLCAAPQVHVGCESARMLFFQLNPIWLTSSCFFILFFFFTQNIPVRTMEVFHSLEELMSPYQNMKNYRDKMLASHPPLIPVLREFFFFIFSFRCVFPHFVCLFSSSGNY